MVPHLRRHLIAILAIITVFVGAIIVRLEPRSLIPLLSYLQLSTNTSTTSASPQPTPLETKSLIGATASPSATPSPTPMSFADMNRLYGPCVYLPTLMYHHISTTATSNNVDPEHFSTQLSYLNDRGYHSITPEDLINFFTSNTPLPPKPILITVDDGYADNFTDAFPLLQQYNIKATIFLATGLMDNPNYLSWNQIQQMHSSGLITFGNHTWSHHQTLSDRDAILKEISLANTQLNDHGLPTTTFAYPYGDDSVLTESILTDLGYQLAFTTQPGSTLCKQKHFSLPRIRVGNAPLSAYGL